MKTTKIICINNDHELANGFHLTIGKVYEYTHGYANGISLGYIMDDDNWTFAFDIDMCVDSSIYGKSKSSKRKRGLNNISVIFEFSKVFKTLDEIRDEKLNQILP
jgi:hypothetical protein